MGFLGDKPEPFRRGQRQLSEHDLNLLREESLRQVRGGRGVQSSYYGDRLLLSGKDSIPPAPDLNTVTTQLVVGRVLDDLLLCSPPALPATNSGFAPYTQPGQGAAPPGPVALYVARPYLLQRTPWDGRSITSPGSDQGNPQAPFSGTYQYGGDGSRVLVRAPDGTQGGRASQAVTPPYYPGEVITAVRVVTGYQDPSGNQVLWMDLNTAGRTWQGYGTPLDSFGYAHVGPGATLNTTNPTFYYIPVTGQGPPLLNVMDSYTYGSVTVPLPPNAPLPAAGVELANYLTNTVRVRVWFNATGVLKSQAPGDRLYAFLGVGVPPGGNALLVETSCRVLVQAVGTAEAVGSASVSMIMDGLTVCGKLLSVLFGASLTNPVDASNYAGLVGNGFLPVPSYVTPGSELGYEILRS